MKTRLSRDNKSEVLRSSLSFGMFLFQDIRREADTNALIMERRERERDSKEWMETLKLIIAKTLML